VHAQRGYKLLSSAFSEEETLNDQVPLTLHRWYENATSSRASGPILHSGPWLYSSSLVMVQSQF